MTLELQKRIFTSISLFLLVYVFIFINIYISAAALIFISLISWIEFIKLTNQIYRNKNELAANLLLIFSALYLTIFAGISFYIIVFDKIYFLYILFVCIFSDIGGYVFGKTFKGAKLTSISPNKTKSGAYGSFIFSIIPYLIFKIISLSTSGIIFFTDGLILNITMCFYISLVCQAGDLFISFFKRLAKVKDTGKILPGHGGILDRIDGIIFAIPAIGILGYLLKIAGL